MAEDLVLPSTSGAGTSNTEKNVSIEKPGWGLESGVSGPVIRRSHVLPKSTCFQCSKFVKVVHIGLGRIPTGLLPYSSRDTQGTRTYPGQTPYDCVISADYRTRIGRAPEGNRTISDDDRPMSLRHPIKNCSPLSTHCRPIIFRISPEALLSPEKNLTTTTMTDRFSPALRHRRTPPICRYPPAAGLNVTEVSRKVMH